MKWVNIFRRKRCKEEVSSDDELSDLRTHDPNQTRSKRRSISFEHDRDPFHPHEKRTSLEQWQDVRHARNSVDGQSTAPRTTGILTVSKAGDTTILNNTYIMIKHLGSGTFGKVKLCFNIRNQKLYAVKSCRKSQLLKSLDHGLRRRSNLGPASQPTQPAVAAAAAAAAFAGSGSFSTGCRRGFAGRSCAVVQEARSKLQASHLKTEDVVREIAILKKLKHPNIVTLVEVIDDPRTDSLLLVMEYVEGSTLEGKQTGQQAWEPMPEHEIWWCTRDVLQGLEYLHFHHVVHGDLKPANLLRDSNSGAIKITDFSSSTVALSDATLPGSSAFCTPAFRPPESLNAGYRASFQMDMWALGVCLYQWAYGELPFSGSNPFAVYEKIRDSPVALPAAPHLSAQLQDLILRLLDKNPATRLDVTGVMSHPWVTQGGEEPLVGLAGQRLGGAGEEEAGGEEEGDEEEEGAGGVGEGPMEVTQEEIDAAIREGDHAASLLDNIFHQHLYQHRQHLATCGEAADKIFLIAQGEVEIYRSALWPEGPMAPIISGLPDAMEEEEPVSDFVDVPCGIVNSHMDANNSQHQQQAQQPRPGSSDLQHGPAPEGFRLLAVRGPGESLGLGPLHRDPKHPHVWQASVRAKDEVVAFVAEVDDVLRLLAEHPEMEGIVQQICSQQQTDMMVANAMRQLCLTLPPRQPCQPEAPATPAAATPPSV